MILKNISKRYDDKIIFKNFNFECQNNDFVTIIGKSGVGKTTLLNIVAGLTDYTGLVEGVNKVSYMFQDDILLDSLTVQENLMLALSATEEQVKNWADEFEVAPYLKLKPAQLSGGIARRVSLIRALKFDADVLLLDEPTKSLDVQNKHICLENIFAELKTKPRLTLCVTHDFNDFANITTKIIRL